MKTSLLAVSCAALSFLPCDALADSLTEDKIRAFLDQSTLLTHQDNDMSDEQIADYLDDHVDDRGVFKSTIMYDIPGYPPQMRDVALNKSDFIKNIIDGRKTMENYTSSVTLKHADIQGNKATIRTETIESGIAPMNDTDRAAFDGRSSCNQTLYENGGDIVLSSAACETIITFKE